MRIDFLYSSVGKKIIVAVTGLFLLGFLFSHLIGNLLIFLGPNALNAYAEKLAHLEVLVWFARIFLFICFITHITISINLSLENRRARSASYSKFKSSETTISAKTMILSGLIIFSFVVYHLLHFTFRVTNPSISHLEDSLGRRDVYSMVVFSFQNLAIAASYVVAISLLCMHLSHGIASMFQTLGIFNEKHVKWLKWGSRTVAIILFCGFNSIPVFAYFGWLYLPSGVHG